jgi:uncharacterized protein
LTYQVSDRQQLGGDAAEPFGHVLSVRGSEAQVGLPSPSSNDEVRATVGKFLAIGAGRRRLIGMVTEVSVNNSNGLHGAHSGAVARVDLMGEIRRDASGADSFRRGVAE